MLILYTFYLQNKLYTKHTQSELRLHFIYKTIISNMRLFKFLIKVEFY